MSYGDELAYQAALARELTQTAPEHPCTCGPGGKSDTRYWISEGAAEKVNGECGREGRQWQVGPPSLVCPTCGGELKLIQVVFDEPALPYYGS
jgi:hypothetical protein